MSSRPATSRSEAIGATGGAAPKRTRASLATKLAVSLSVLVLGLVLLECVHRARFYGVAGFVPGDLASIRPLGDSGLVRAAASPGLRFELRPNHSQRFKLATITTNSEGMRDEEHPRAKPPGTFRIAVVGDSFTMGSGVDVEEIYPNVLEDLLNAGGDEVRYECLNFGVGGYGLIDYLGLLSEKVLAFEPDLVLFGLVVNDTRKPPEDYLTKPFVEANIERPFLRLTFLEDLDHEPDPTIDASYKGRRSYQRDSLYALCATLLPTRTPAFFAYLTTSFNEREQEFAERFARFAEQTSSGFLDTGRLFDGLDRTEYEILPGDQHPNARAHAVYAEAIHAALRQGGWLGSGGR